MADKAAGRSEGDSAERTRQAESCGRQRFKLQIAYGNALIAPTRHVAAGDDRSFRQALASLPAAIDDSPNASRPTTVFGSGIRARRLARRCGSMAESFLRDAEARAEFGRSRRRSPRSLGLTCWFAGEYRRGADAPRAGAGASTIPSATSELWVSLRHDPGVAAMLYLALDVVAAGRDRRATRLAGGDAEPSASRAGTSPTHAHAATAHGPCSNSCAAICRSACAPNAQSLLETRREHGLPNLRVLGGVSSRLGREAELRDPQTGIEDYASRRRASTRAETFCH